MKKQSSPYILSSEELRKMQMVLLEMLLELDRICKEHGIRYALDGGTLLGAVRHRGFIPWDDDIDVVMMRGEYDRFREACLKDLNTEKFFYQDHITDPYYPWGYARLRRKNSEFVRVGQEHLKMQTGIFLDIFPRDNVPDGFIPRIFHNFYCFLLRKVLYSKVGTKAGKTIFHRAIYSVLQHIPAEFVFRRLDKLGKYWNLKNTELMRTLTFPILLRGRYGYDRKWFEEFIDAEFEGYILPCARDYDGYLKCLYGDYMTLPPENKRHWHPVAKFRLPEDG